MRARARARLLANQPFVYSATIDWVHFLLFYKKKVNLKLAAADSSVSKSDLDPVDLILCLPEVEK